MGLGDVVGIRKVKIKTADALGGKEMEFIDTRYFLKTWLAQFSESFLVRIIFVAMLVSSFLFEGPIATVVRIVLLIFVFYAYERRIRELKVIKEEKVHEAVNKGASISSVEPPPV